MGRGPAVRTRPRLVKILVSITGSVDQDLLVLLKAVGVKPVKLPARSPNLNAHAEGLVLPVKTESLSMMSLFAEASLRRALSQFVEHYHVEKPHQGKGNVILFAEEDANTDRAGPVQCRERLGGLLRFYYRGAG